MITFIKVVVLSCILWSCNNDLDLYSQKQVLPYVYGSISPSEKNHYIKVTKTFQKLPENVEFEDMYYHDDSIQVFVDVYQESDLIESHLALPVLAHDKDEGVFPFPTHKYYKISDVVLLNHTNKRYALRIEFANGKTVGSLKPFTFLKPYTVNEPNLHFVDKSEIDFENIVGDLNPFTFKWIQKGGGREEAIFTISFLETNTITNQIDTVSVPISFYDKIPSKDEVSAPLHLSHVFSILKEKLEKNPNIKRRMLKTEIVNVGAAKEIRAYGLALDLWVEAKDITTYETIMFSQPGISQDIPNFTNLENALGIFASKLHKHINHSSERLYFGTQAMDLLACSTDFFEYNFAKSYIDEYGELQIDDSPDRCK